MDRPARMLIYVIGLAIVVAGIWVLFTQTPLADLVPAGIVLAVVLLIVGIGVMMMSSSSWAGRSVVVERTGYAPGYAPRPYDRVDRVEREVVYDDDRPPL